MRRFVGAILLVASFLAAPSLELCAQKEKDKKKGPDPGAPVDSAKLHSGEFVGMIKSPVGSNQTFVLTNEIQRLVPTGKGGQPNQNNPAYKIVQTQNRIAQDQAQVQNARNPQQRMQAVQRLQQHYAELQREIAQMQGNNGKGGTGVPAGYKIETAKQDIEFQASDTVKVRTMLLPEVFDDKGNVKKYTKEELSELKGKDKAQVGYESALDKLETGQKVRVKLAPAPRKVPEKDQDKDAEKKDDDKRMQVSLIVILEEAKNTGKGQPKKKNK